MSVEFNRTAFDGNIIDYTYTTKTLEHFIWNTKEGEKFWLTNPFVRQRADT